jgi:hypothetical protein
MKLTQNMALMSGKPLMDVELDLEQTESLEVSLSREVKRHENKRLGRHRCFIT